MEYNFWLDLNRQFGILRATYCGVHRWLVRGRARRWFHRDGMFACVNESVHNGSRPGMSGVVSCRDPGAFIGSVSPTVVPQFVYSLFTAEKTPRRICVCIISALVATITYTSASSQTCQFHCCPIVQPATFLSQWNQSLLRKSHSSRSRHSPLSAYCQEFFYLNFQTKKKKSNQLKIRLNSWHDPNYTNLPPTRITGEEALVF